jgi:hypothetical protein
MCFYLILRTIIVNGTALRRRTPISMFLVPSRHFRLAKIGTGRNQAPEAVAALLYLARELN